MMVAPGAQGPEKRKLGAIAAAVYAYLRSQEEQQLAMAAMPPPAVTAGIGGASLWAASGRQAIMEMRRLLQLRIGR